MVSPSKTPIHSHSMRPVTVYVDVGPTTVVVTVAVIVDTIPRSRMMVDVG
jgi:hypothetical protein